MDEDLAARLERIERRLDALEARPVSAPRSAAPPVYYAATQPTQPAAAVPEVDLETILGSRWLPRAGALAIVAALAYLVALGLQRGVITPAMVVLGIAAACAGIIALGMRLKDERESYGHVLVGLGAAGLYVDTTGAHLYQNLIGGEAMVGLCLAISLASLGYGLWRALPSFLGVGLSGGLVAALMPLSQGNTATAAGLLLLVSLPTFAIAAGRRWPTAVVGAWLASSAACIPILLAHGPVSVRLLPLDAVLLIALAAWSVSAERLPATDPQGAFAPAAAGIAGVAALATYHGSEGSAHLFGLGLAAIATGALLRTRQSGRRVMLAGALLAGTIAPFGLPGHNVEFALAIASLAGAALAYRFRSIAPFAAFEVLLALVAYLGNSQLAETATKTQEAGLIGLLLLSAVANALVLDLREGRVAAGLIVWGLVSRLAIIGLDLPSNAAITLAWIAVCAGLFVVGFLRQRPELRQLGLAVAAVTGTKVVLVDLAGLDSALKAAVLLILGVVLLTGGYAYVRRDRLKGNLGG